MAIRGFEFLAPSIIDYTATLSASSDLILDELTKDTQEKMDLPQMLSGPEVTGLLSLFIHLTQAKHVLEVGCFTGYSAISMAKALPSDGSVTTLERDERPLKIAYEYFNKHPAGQKIHVIEGQALNILETLNETYDLIFVDANKIDYPTFYHALLPKLKKTGVMVFDNTLWYGTVLNPEKPSEIAVANLNQQISQDPRVNNVLLTVRDGLHCVWWAT